MGPTLPISKEIGKTKYLQPGESFQEGMARVAHRLKDNDDHFEYFRDLLYHQIFMPAGRVMAAVGATRIVTPYNCFVSGTIQDSMDGIMDKAKEAAQTMRMGGGIGYDFSTLRPFGTPISTLDSPSSGAVSFMQVFNAVCGTISSAGHRRGAQMGVLRIDHPDIEEFIHAKQNNNNLTNFNVSIAVPDAFMTAMLKGESYDLKWNDKVYRTVDARNLWDSVMRGTYDWAEPGVLFIDRINNYNNLHKSEVIAATNPCAEQPLPPYGACLLGSLNVVKLVNEEFDGTAWVDLDKLRQHMPHIVRAMDNVVDVATYPLEAQEAEAKNKRRMGLGVTGMANALERVGHPYGSSGYIKLQSEILEALQHEAYSASADLAKEKGPYPLWDFSEFRESATYQSLSPKLQRKIKRTGLRNSHLTSIAPTGTISLFADNISSGIEPVWQHKYNRLVNLSPTIQSEETVEDYGYRVWNIKGRTTEEVTVDEHVDVLINAQKYVDSAVSKTCNVGSDVGYDEFKEVYLKAWRGGAKGCTTFRAAGKRFGILKAIDDEGEVEGAACYIDPETGEKSCE